jgi:hypothetical protein
LELQNSLSKEGLKLAETKLDKWIGREKYLRLIQREFTNPAN